MKLLSLDVFYAVAGVFMLLVAGRAAWDRAHPTRWGSAIFWGLLAITFLGGKSLPPVVVGESYGQVMRFLLAEQKDW